MRYTLRNPTHRPFDESEATLRIARAAKRVFLSSGGSKFSMRTVAVEAGMSTGALQHFYPKRDMLLAAMLEFIVNEYEQGYEQVFSRLPFNGEARLLGAVGYLSGDIWRTETREFFFSLWALSCHNEVAAELMHDVYTHHLRRLAGFVGAARPRLSEERCLQIAYQIAAMVEGFMVFTGPGTRRFTPKALPAKLIRRAVLDLLDSGR